MMPPDDQGSDEDPDEDGDGTDDLAGEARTVVGDRHQQQTQQTDHTVHGDGTDRIVDLQFVQRHDAEDHQDTAQSAPDGGNQRSRGGRFQR